MAIWSEAGNSDAALGQRWFGRALSEVELEAQPFNASLPGSTAAGRLCVSVHPLLKAHVGTHPDLILRWNAMVAPGTIDVVVHLHGFNVRAQSMSLDKDVEPICGLDFHNPSAPAEPGRTQPTLAVLPRGNWAGSHPGWRHDAYTFPALGEAGALRRLTDDALARFAAATGVRARRGRLIVTAHSGGGNCLLEMLAHIDPDEVHIFDGLYRDPTNLIEWMRSRIAREPGRSGSPAVTSPGALRVLCRPGTSNLHYANDVQRGLLKALSGLADHSMARRFRVEATQVEHCQLPFRFGWRFLRDASADVAETSLHLGLPSPSPRRRHR